MIPNMNWPFNGLINPCNQVKKLQHKTAFRTNMKYGSIKVFLGIEEHLLYLTYLQC